MSDIESLQYEIQKLEKDINNLRSIRRTLYREIVSSVEGGNLYKELYRNHLYDRHHHQPPPPKKTVKSFMLEVAQKLLPSVTPNRQSTPRRIEDDFELI